MKRIKYTNGSSVISRKFYTRVGDMDVAGKGSFNIPTLTAAVDANISKNIKGTKLTAGAYKDTKGKTGESFSVEKQLPNSSVTLQKNRTGTNVSLHKNIGNMYGKLTAGKQDTTIGNKVIKGEKQILFNVTIPLGRR
tara:strand:- start:2598 stop:3008 length:411 start_codon:yes stop_codon:yes gene_type:complete